MLGECSGRWHQCSRLLVASWLLVAVLAADADTESAPGLSPVDWQQLGKVPFVDYLAARGCPECAAESAANLHIASAIFGCADADVLLPTLYYIYEATRNRLGGALPGILVDGGANIGRVSSRWIGAMGDVFARRSARNATQAPCIICAGARATASGGAEGAAAAPPTVVVAAVEPSESNFVLLQKYANENFWYEEGFIPIQAALGDERGEATLAVEKGFAIDEIATIIVKPGDQRPRQPVRVITLEEVVETAYQAYPGLSPGEGIFLLKLDIEGMEPKVLRSLARLGMPVKFVTFEYAGDVWQESLSGVVYDLFRIGYFCFIVTAERLFPVSGPFWHPIYEMSVWSNLFCGQTEDPDLEAVVQMHSGNVGVWPAMSGYFLPGFANGDQTTYSLTKAQFRCLDLGNKCAGVTCVCQGACAAASFVPPSATSRSPPSQCTLREGYGGLLKSPNDEITFLRDPASGDPFLAYRRMAILESYGEEPVGWP